MSRLVLVIIAIVLIVALFLIPEQTNDADLVSPETVTEPATAAAPRIGEIDDQRIAAAESERDAWLAYVRD